MKEDDPLEDLTAREITLDGVAKRVYVAGTGPAVIVMTEMPGISPQVARFARWVRGAGFTVYMPSLFGRDGAVPGAEEGTEVFKRACVSAEFRALAANQSSPVTKWLRALARLAHQECGGLGVGAIGMCFTGNFALTMMLEPSMLAPVLSQPALPVNDPAGLEIAPEEIKAVRERLDRDGLTVLAYRFAGDKFCRAERFAAYAASSGGCCRTAPRTPTSRPSSRSASRVRTASSPPTSLTPPASRRSPPAMRSSPSLPNAWPEHGHDRLSAILSNILPVRGCASHLRFSRS
jgi:dienelactone hydrolase